MNLPGWFLSGPNARKSHPPARRGRLTRRATPALEHLERRLMLSAAEASLLGDPGPAGGGDDGVSISAVVDLGPERDNTLYESPTGSISNGAGDFFFVGRTSRSGDVRRGLLRFDVAVEVPAGSTIDSVQLTLEMSRTISGGQNVELHKALADWGEGASDAPGSEGGGTTAAVGDATWIHTFFNTDAWANPGGDFSAAVSASTSVAGLGGYTWGSTPQMVADVQQWLDDPAANFGWVLTGNEAAIATAKRFNSKENGSAASRPVLAVEFTPPPPPELSIQDVSVVEGDAGTVEAVFPVTLSAPAAGSVTVDYATADGTAEGLHTVRVAAGLSRPVYATSPPGDSDRLFIVEQHSGRIKILNLGTGLVNDAPFLDIDGLSTGNEQGLLGLAFHPDYSQNGLFFVYFTDSGRSTNVVRYQVSAGDPDLADPASATTVITYGQPQGNHNGGWIGFGPDGYLYVASGDGGASNDSGSGHTVDGGNAQDVTDNLLGKMLRLDVDADDFPADPNRNYAVPPSNPLVGLTGDDEIWSYGLRNPWRSSFDRASGDLLIADVGQGAREEINFQPADSGGGENYGWRLREGTIATPADGVGGDRPPGAIDPIYDYPHGSGPTRGDSVTGGYVYRGPIAQLRGLYFFADFINQRVWSLRFDGSQPDQFDGTNFTEFTDWTKLLNPDFGTVGGVSSFGEDALGNLYIVDLGGDVFRIEAGADYRPTTGTLTFTSGQTQQTIVVPVIGDTLDEIDETFLVNLSGAAGATISAGQGEGTILDDDPPAEVAGRHIAYNNSAFDGADPAANSLDDGAIAPDKRALLPGGTAALENYTSFSRGINLVMVDVANLPPVGHALNWDDYFEFKVGNDGTPADWDPAAPPLAVTLRPGDGTGGSDRLTIVWADNAIEKQWLQVTVLANAQTGLAEPDEFYFGNAIGETLNSATDTKVNAIDMLGARDNQRTFLDPAPIDFAFDFNRDARVNAVDMLIARNNTTHFLNALGLITVPAAGGLEAASPDAGIRSGESDGSGGSGPSPGGSDWIAEFQPAGVLDLSGATDDPAKEAVDAVLATV